MNKVIFVIDMLNGFAKKGNLYSKTIEEKIIPIKNYLKENKKAFKVFLNDKHLKNDLEMNYYPLHCLNGTYEAEIVEELKPYVDKIFTKNCTNSFFSINKDFYNNYEEFDLVGCCTDICILEFALSLKSYFNSIKKDAKINVIKECVATYDSDEHNAKSYNDFALNLLKNAGVNIK
ncbi:UNVERIFIED_CONTAM: cysteine hydrolase [Campylobacter lari]